MKRVLLNFILILAVAAAVLMVERAWGNRDSAPAFAAADGRVNAALVIDPGHGGADGGAVSDSGARECDINLDIATKLDMLAAFCGVKTVMTRDTDEITYTKNANTIRKKKVEDIKNRVEIANSTENAVLISIHQNRYPSSGPFGAQALYAPTVGSKELAERMQAVLIKSLNQENYRAAARIPETIYLMNKVKCPAILVECGFLSNPNEDALLQTDEYRLKIAAAVIAGYLGA